jgi:CxxC-x17-CxxC domain-containing protein
MTDKTLNCSECAAAFVFTEAEQEFYETRNLTNLPKRCPNCRVLSRLKRDGKDLTNVTDVNCAACGTLTKVPFKPQGYKPVYCASCLRSTQLA